MLISFKVFSLLNHPKTDKTISRWTIRWCHFKKKMTSVQGRERGAPIEQRRVSKSQKSLFILSKFFLSKNDPWRMALRGWPSKDSLEGWPYRDCLRRMDLEGGTCKTVFLVWILFQLAWEAGWSSRRSIQKWLPVPFWLDLVEWLFRFVFCIFLLTSLYFRVCFI